MERKKNTVHGLQYPELQHSITHPSVKWQKDAGYQNLPISHI
jgi:hypothetical protein